MNDWLQWSKEINKWENEQRKLWFANGIKIKKRATETLTCQRNAIIFWREPPARAALIGRTVMYPGVWRIFLLIISPPGLGDRPNYVVRFVDRLQTIQNSNATTAVQPIYNGDDTRREFYTWGARVAETNPVFERCLRWVCQNVQKVFEGTSGKQYKTLR